MAKQPTINLGEQLRKKAHDGLLTGLEEAAFIRADGINLPKEAYRIVKRLFICLLYTSPSPRDLSTSRMPSSA